MLPLCPRPARPAGRLLVRLGLGAALLAPALAARAQARVLGPQDCEKCHKAALRKWKIEEPAQQGAKAHTNTHKQLSDPKAARFAAAIGQADALDVKGRCVACHGTVVRGILRVGVSCESCHGAASQWNPVHDKAPLAESYKKAVGLGLRDLHDKPAAIAALCVSCHVTPEKALAAAGHPNGAAFDAGASLRKLVHWTAAFSGDGSEHARYDYAALSAVAKPLVAKALASAVAPRAGQAAAVPRAGVAPSASVAPTAPRPTSRASAAEVATTGPAPWDWDQPLPALPDDYPSDDSAPDAPETSSAPVAEVAAPRAPRATRSLVVDQPVVPEPDVVLEAPSPAGPAPAASATSAAAALRGEALLLLESLLKRGRRAPHLARARPPQEFKGPDSELLALQDVVLYLALETLRQPAAPPTKARP